MRGRRGDAEKKMVEQDGGQVNCIEFQWQIALILNIKDVLRDFTEEIPSTLTE